MNNIRLISASAGSGKTYSLTEIFVSALEEGGRPEGVLATTFTKKAAAELGGRFRMKLLEQGKNDEAQQVYDGYIGTVNSVCGNLLKDYAFEMGLSPSLDVLPDGEEAAIFSVAVADVIGRYMPNIFPVLQSLEISEWKDTVRSIINKARANGISGKDLHESGKKSWSSFQNQLPAPRPENEEEQLDRNLLAELDSAIQAIPVDGDETKGTANAKSALQSMKRSMRSGKLPNWSSWVKLSKIGATKKSDEMLDDLRQTASEFLEHPRFHKDVKTLITLLFSCAAEASELYAKHKKELGLIDFTDQETLAMKLMDTPEAAELLGERLDMVMVDEFQDTSPIQLALFLKMARLAKKSIWVGDQKQSIYGFRGSDPALMDSVINALGEPEDLPCSWRSQPALVNFASEYFAHGFKPYGFPESRVRLTPQVPATSPKRPHLRCWKLAAKNKTNDVLCVVNGIVDLLSHTKEHIVLDKNTGQERELKPCDIAILCRTNGECITFTEQLEANGIRVAIPRSGLMSRPETVLVMAAFRYLINERDSLAVAELARVTGQNDWFAEALEQGIESIKAGIPVFQELDKARKKLPALTPSEALDVAITISGSLQHSLKWPNWQLRRSNIDALRGLTVQFEDHCKARRSACTFVGLVTYLNELSAKEEDTQATGLGEDAVQVLTYHKSKGLEWPMVIITALDSKERQNPFGLNVETEGEFELENPLKGRWLRYWPWPFGAQKSIEDFFLNDNETKTKIGPFAENTIAETAFEKERQERMRLLYVGLTRARDYMIFTARESDKRMTPWLDSCEDKDGNPLLSLPSSEGAADIKMGDKSFPIETTFYSPFEEDIVQSGEQLYQPLLKTETCEHPPASFTPGAVEYTEGKIEVSFKRIGDPFSIKVEDSVLLGDVVHGFLAVDDQADSMEKRIKRSENIIAESGITGISAEALIEMSNRMHDFISKNFCGEENLLLTEWPISLKNGLQKANGWIDMICRTSEGDIIIDHKTACGSDTWMNMKARSYAGQLATYKDVLEKSQNTTVRGTWLHFPVAGLMAEIKFSE